MKYMNVHGLQPSEVAYNSKALTSLVQFALSNSSENNPPESHGDASYGMWFALEMVKEGIDHLSKNAGAEGGTESAPGPCVRRVA